MKAIKIKVEHPMDIYTLQRLVSRYGFVISNPDQLKGDLFTIVSKGKQKFAGFDLFIKENKFSIYYSTYYGYNQVIQWLKENGDTETTG